MTAFQPRPVSRLLDGLRRSSSFQERRGEVCLTSGIAISRLGQGPTEFGLDPQPVRGLRSGEVLMQ